VDIRAKLRTGLVIPAHPLALNRERELDERRQRALTRYCLAAGAGGIAVAVHTTQFAICDPEVGLLEPVLKLAIEESGKHDVVKIAGVCGKTRQACQEATLPANMGYDAVLLSLGALPEASLPELLAHAREVASIIPIMGFYLQPSVGGRQLPYEFWRRFCDIENVVAIKVAPFNRYQTLDVLRAVVDSGRAHQISLYTGNDENILIDLLTTFNFGGVSVRFAGGLLGHWAVWTKSAVAHLEMVKKHAGQPTSELLTLAQQITDSNAAFFDPSHLFHGCVAGIHEVLRRQGLLEGRWCLDPCEDLSPGQAEQMDRVYRAYTHLNDDAFVAEHLDEWLE
jgi:dihydrodipicolinate synthase/N-acetylneuraminate lyase